MLSNWRMRRGGTLLMLSLFLVSCGGPFVQNPTPVGAPGTATVYPQQEYRIRTGDILDIKFFYNPELNEVAAVRPDGRISLQLVGEITAAGKSPAELNSELSSKYANDLRNPAVTVIVRTFSAYKVFIDGEVNAPGAIDLTGPLTVLQSISYAGGLKNTARTKEIVVIRKGENNQPMAIPINVQDVYKGVNISQDIVLAPNDIVFVPRSPIANVDLWVQQYLRDAILVLPNEVLLYYGLTR